MANPFLNRELSWLEFNRRVLEEAQDRGNPLLERLRFFCIHHSNLDEFFMVRVASLLRRLEEGDEKPDAAGLTPGGELEQVLERVREEQETVRRLYLEDLLPALAEEGIRILSPGELTQDQVQHLDGYFEAEIYPVLTPLAMDRADPPPRIAGLAVHLAFLVEPASRRESAPHLAVLQIPAGLPGLTRISPQDGAQYTWLADIIRRRAGALFPGFRILEAAAFRITRDSEMELDDEGHQDYVHMLESGLKQRTRAGLVRLEYEEGMSAALRREMEKRFEVDPRALLAVAGPLDARPLLAVADAPGFDKLRFPPQPPILPPAFESERNIFDIIRDGDVLLHHPYDSFDPVIALIEEAAEDPDVLAVKQTLYRTGGAGSPLAKALARAARNGKQVTALLELTARFDEERNIRWARDLEDAGAHVLYGVAGLKVHAKIALVVRREPGGLRRYVHLGTGNYNDRTARLYTDYGLLTADDDFGADASGFFNTITGYSEPPGFRRLTMAPLGIRERIVALIRRETDRANSGQPAGITAKMNSLVDERIIRELHKAARAGVPIHLCVRGICCLRPPPPAGREEIRVISIVDRYLEHGRAFVFRNGGNTEVYLSSADWMPRNLDRRVELMFPVVGEAARVRVIEELEAEFADNRKARVLGADGRYRLREPGDAALYRVQVDLYRKIREERSRARSIAPTRFVPIEPPPRG